MYLARKFERAKWDAQYGVAVGEIPADAVSVDLRTSKNTLSFWDCGEATLDEIKDVVLALAAARDRNDKVDVVWVAKDKMAIHKLEIIESQGKTLVKSLVDKHRDAIALDYVRLGEIAHVLAESLDNGRYHRFTRQEVVKIIGVAVSDGRIKKNDLTEKVRRDLDAPQS